MEFIPEDEDIRQAIQKLEFFIGHGDIESDTNYEIFLMDIGDNLEAIICPECSQTNIINYADDNDVINSWWEKIEPAVEEVPASGVKVVMPCCGKTVDFIALKFNSPSGFAKHYFTCYEPDEGMLTNEQLAELSVILKCKLKQVWARY